MKTKDGYTVQIGTWVEDAYGLWEITSIDGQFVNVREAIVNEDETVDYGMRKSLTHKEFEETTYYL